MRFRPEMHARTDAVEAALTAIETGSCTDELREAAHQAAHKLAGSLGMFGSKRGTEIARSLEGYFAEEKSSQDAATLHESVAELRRIIGE